MPTAKIELKAKPIDGDPSKYHLFIVYTVTDDNNVSTSFVMRGGPSADPQSFASEVAPQLVGGILPIPNFGNPFGNIKTTQDIYQLGSVDWAPNARSSLVISGTQDQIQPYFLALSDRMHAIDQEGYRYNPISQNSNTVAFQSLLDVGLHPTLPTYNDGTTIWAPGYNTNFTTPLQELQIALATTTNEVRNWVNDALGAVANNAALLGSKTLEILNAINPIGAANAAAIDTAAVDAFDLNNYVGENSPWNTNNDAWSSPGWQDGFVKSMGNYDIHFNPNILNGDGLTNVAPSSSLSNGIRPGAQQLVELDLDKIFRKEPYILWADSRGNLVAASTVDVKQVISLGGLNNEKTHSTTTQNVDPLVLDLNGNGIELKSYQKANVLFNMDSDSFKEQTGWVGGGDGFLVMDKNSNGVIDDITEMFSEYYTTGVTNGLQALATLDSNHDNVFNASDTTFSQVRVWQDANGDGRTDAGELKTLSSLGITAISLIGTAGNGAVIEGNEVQATATMTMNGVSRSVAAINLLANPAGHEWTIESNGITINSEAGTSSFAVSNQAGATVNVATEGVQSAYGNIGNDTLIGDANSNWLGGGAGSDTIMAGAGDDVLIIDAQDLQANIDGGDGFDIVQVVGVGGINFNLSQAHVELAAGGDGDDVLVGGGTSTVFISGGAGNDIIIGSGANDSLSGNDGNDMVDGGYGNDIMRGHRGDDLLIGGFGDDLLEGGLGNDVLNGGDGDDVVNGGGGVDTADGGNGTDLAQFTGSYSEYTHTVLADGSIKMVDNVANRDGTIALKNVEYFNFRDIISLSVNLPNPMTVNDKINVAASGPYTIQSSTLLANDIDYQGDALHITAVNDAVGGTVSLNSGIITFTPTAGYAGVMSFKYKIADVQNNPGAGVAVYGTNTTAEMRGVVYLKTPSQPNDPLFSDQWYLQDINVLPVWNDYTGRNIKVGVFEPGIFDPTHPDLLQNVNPQFLANYNASDVTTHGTLVAGVIGAARNTHGGVGVAYDSQLSSVSVVDAAGFTDQTKLAQMVNYDVVNNSWAALPHLTINFLNDTTSANAVIDAATHGRNGYGTIMVWGAGNDRGAGGDAVDTYRNSSHYGIQVGAINKVTDLSALEVGHSPFSSPGASILISAPGSDIQSTSRLYQNPDGDSFGGSYEAAQGTSFATPIVSGVVALMLEANPTLYYNEVQKILAYTARQVTDASTTWTYNAAKNWNGGGLHVSNDYGFGEVDALAAVRLAETWNITPHNNSSIIIDSPTLNSSIPDGTSSLVSTINVTSTTQAVEYVEVRLNLTHAQVGDLVVKLVAPNGTESILLNRDGKLPGSTDADSRGYGAITTDTPLVLVTTHDFGENAAGNWQLKIEDKAGGQVGTLQSWQLQIYGQVADGNDTYVYTNEFSSATGSRLTLTDTSGVDNLNAAAVSGDSAINLNPGQNSTIAGKTLTISASTTIENAFTGDGNDTIIGNSADNLLFGGRGNDSISGGQGNDWLFGGLGADTLDGGSGVDFVSYSQSKAAVSVNLASNANTGSEAQGDIISNIENIYGSNYDDNLAGDANANTIVGAGGNDILVGGAGADTFDGGVGVDTVSYANSSAAVTVNLTTNVNTGGDAAGDLLYNVENINGSNFNDTITGDANANIINGLDGNDTFVGGAGADTLDGGNGTDTLDYTASSAAVTVNLVTNVNTGGDAAGDLLYNIENVIGSASADTIVGNSSTNTLSGGAGGDTLYNGAGGNDILTGGTGADTFIIQKAINTNTVITDFSTSTTGEVILLQGFTGAVDFAHLVITQSGSNALITLENGQTLTLQNVTASSLTAASFGQSSPIMGTSGDDQLSGTSGIDNIQALAGNDWIFGSLGADTLDGGTGTDGAGYSNSSSAVTVNLATNVNTGGYAQGDTLISIENINGSNYDDSLTGDANSNTIFGNVGNDTISGGDGNDWLYGDAGADILNGGNGTDGAEYRFSASAVTVNLATNVNTGGDAQGDTLASIEIVDGSNYDDNITGDANANTLNGLGGNDILAGGAAADTLDGGNGTDMADYSASGTAVTVNLTSNVNTGGDAAGDLLYNIENVTGSAFADTITGNANTNVLNGAAGNDVINATAGGDTIDGGTGEDRVSFAASTAAVTVNLATNVNTGGYAAGMLLANVEDITGSAFADTITGDGNANVLDGGAGIDTASYILSTAAVTINLVTNLNTGGTAQDDSLLNIENINGSNYNDNITGDANANFLNGLDGSDTLVGGAGADTLDGGNGTDLAYYSTSAAAVTVNLATNVNTGGDAAGDSLLNIENVTGSAFADTITGSTATNTLAGGAGNDTLNNGAGGNDILTGGTGADTFIIQKAVSSSTIITDFSTSTSGEVILLQGFTGAVDFAHLAITQSGSDALITLENGQTLTLQNVTASSLTAASFGQSSPIIGTSGDDLLYGTNGSDDIQALAGNDWIYSSPGADTIDGGNGNDGADYRSSTTGVTVNLLTNVNTGGDAQGDSLVNIEMVGGSNLNDAVTGDANANTLYGNAGNDSLSGGDGNDWLDGGAGADTIDGGNGTDTASYLGSTVGVVINLATNINSAGDAAGDTLTNIETIFGSGFNDSLTGNASANTFYGMDGNDTLVGAAGADTLDGGNGADTVDYSSAGAAVTINLTTNVNAGSDAAGDSLLNIENVTGSAFADTITGSAATNTLAGGVGNDTLNNGAGGNDILTGGTGADTFIIQKAINTSTIITDFSTSTSGEVILLQGFTGAVDFAHLTITQSGSDALITLENGQTLTLQNVTASSLTAASFGGTNTITGTSGDDILYGTSGIDNIQALAGNDWVFGSSGADTIDGGTGTDGVGYDSSTSAVTVNLATNVNTGGHAQGDILTSIENLNGSSYDDNLTGDANSNTIFGNVGNDTISGGDGNDWLYGDAGADILHGGNGTDGAEYRFSASAVTVNLATNVNTGGDAQGDSLTSIEIVDGSNYNDSITGDANSNTLNGLDGNDTLAGAAGADTLDGGNGTDTVDYSTSAAVVTVNLATNVNTGGDAAGDLLYNIENVTGSALADNITGDANANLIQSGAGDDVINATAGGDTVDGGAGQDKVSFSASAAAVTVNLATNVHSGGYAAGMSIANVEDITGSAFADTITGDGNSNILDGGAGADTLNGGAGVDTITYTLSTAAVTVNLATNVNTGGYAQGDSLSNIENVVGSTLADNITGDGNNNILDGGAGADTLNGGAGTDTVDYTLSNAAVTVNLTSTNSGGYAQGDTLSNIENVTGSAFNDTITGTTGNNVLSGGLGNDTLIGGAGADVLDGGAGTDYASYANASSGITINMLTGINTGDALGDTLTSIEGIISTNFADTITGSNNADNIQSGSGNDIIYATAGGDTIDGGAGQDLLSFAASTAAINVNLTSNVHSGGYAAGMSISNIEDVTGSDFNDTITGTTGNNVISGGAGNDTLIGGTGADTLDGGTGIDYVSYASSTSGVTINLLTGSNSGGDATGDTLTSIEGIIGSGLADTITGSANADTIQSGAGNDVINATAGGDTIDGGAGQDRVSFSASNVAVNINLASGVHSGGYAAGISLANVEDITGSGFDDTIAGDANTNVLDGGAGTDMVDYSLSNAAVNVNLSSTNTGGYAQGDTLTNFENVTGSAFNDSITGNSGNNLLIGGLGNDTFSGGTGNDTLIGGTGVDNITGGVGNDIIKYSAITDSGINAGNRDIITDFTTASDKIDLGDFAGTFTFRGTSAFTGTANEINYAQTGGNTIIGVDANGDGVLDFQIELTGLKTLAQTDFIL